MGQLDLFVNNESHRKPPSQLFFERACDIFHQNSFSEIKSENSKLRTYAKFKTEIGMEDYLHKIPKIEDRTSLTKIRLSNHHLAIEVGRHNKIPKENRFCPFCPTIVEDEKHFIMNCHAYNQRRTLFF